jgi:uncharacterized LabA/DUF88 family protein
MKKVYVEKAALFIDFHNLEGSLRNEGWQVDILALRDYLSEGRKLIETFVYIGFNPNNPEEDKNYHSKLRTKGFVVRSKEAKEKPDGRLKCDLDIELTLDIVEYVTNVRPDIVIIITGDGDFVPLAYWLRMRGIRVEVGGIPSSMSKNLREAANGYIDLRSFIEGIHEAGLLAPVYREEVITNGNSSDQWKESGDSVGNNG